MVIIIVSTPAQATGKNKNTKQQRRQKTGTWHYHDLILWHSPHFVPIRLEVSMINARDHLIPYSFASVCFCSRIGLRPFLVSPVSGSAWKRLRWPWLQICAWMCTIHPFASNQTKQAAVFMKEGKAEGWWANVVFIFTDVVTWYSDWRHTQSGSLQTLMAGNSQEMVYRK